MMVIRSSRANRSSCPAIGGHTSAGHERGALPHEILHAANDRRVELGLLCGVGERDAERERLHVQHAAPDRDESKLLIFTPQEINVQ